MLGGTEADRARVARQLRRRRRTRVDMVGPVESGVSLLGRASYNLVVAFFQPNLAEFFAKGCITNRVDPPLLVLAPGLRQQCANLQRVLAAAHLPAASFLRWEAEDGELIPILLRILISRQRSDLSCRVRVRGQWWRMPAPEEDIAIREDVPPGCIKGHRLELGCSSGSVVQLCSTTIEMIAL